MIKEVLDFKKIKYLNVFTFLIKSDGLRSKKNIVVTAKLMPKIDPIIKGFSMVVCDNKTINKPCDKAIINLFRPTILLLLFEIFHSCIIKETLLYNAYGTVKRNK